MAAPPPIAASPIAKASAIHTPTGILPMKRAITVAGELEGGTTIVFKFCPLCEKVVVVAALVVAAGPVAAAVPGTSGVVSGLAANAFRPAVAAAARSAPPRAREPVPAPWIASEVMEMPGTGPGEATTGIVGVLGVVATGGAVIGVVKTG